MKNAGSEKYLARLTKNIKFVTVRPAAWLVVAGLLAAACRSQPAPITVSAGATVASTESVIADSLEEQYLKDLAAIPTPACGPIDGTDPGLLEAYDGARVKVIADTLADPRVHLMATERLKAILGDVAMDIRMFANGLVALVAVPRTTLCSSYHPASHESSAVYVITDKGEAWYVGTWGHAPEPDDILWVENRWIVIVEVYGSPSPSRTYVIWHVAPVDDQWARVFVLFPEQEQDIPRGTKPVARKVDVDGIETIEDYQFVVRFKRLQTNTIPCESTKPLADTYYSSDKDVEDVYTWIGDRYGVDETILNDGLTTFDTDNAVWYGLRPWDYYCTSDAQPVFVGKIAFVSDWDGNREIYVVEAGGGPRMRLTNNPASDFDPAWSPDGKRIVFVSDRDGNLELYLMDADGVNVMRLTHTEAIAESSPSWSPDGGRIAFTAQSGAEMQIFAINADGAGLIQLTNDASWNWDPTWSPDGRRIAFVAGRNRNGNICIMNADGTAQMHLTDHPASDISPAWSPDGQRIAFSSNRDGNFGIYTVNADGGTAVRLTQKAYENMSPTWSPDGSKIAFLAEAKSASESEISIVESGGAYDTEFAAWLPDALFVAWSPVGN